MIKFNGKNLPTDSPPVIKSGRTLVPVRVISESLGADVDLDKTARKVTVTKNGSVIELTVNKTEVLKNGAKFAELEVPAQVIEGRTMVPVRFVSEALGANVSWDQAAKTVVVTFEEKRDGMTPEELMLKCNEAMQKYNTYKFKGNAEIKVSAQEAPEDFSTNMTIDGSYRKTGDKAEVYVKETVEIPGIEGSTPDSMNVEVYTDGINIYQRMTGSDWQKIELSADLMQLMQNQDPQKALQMMKDLGLILTHGNEVKIDGKDHYTLMVKIDAEKYLQFMKDILAKAAPANQPAQVAGEKVDFTQIFDELLKNMSIDMSEKVYIAKDTYLMTKAELNGRIMMSILGQAITEDMHMEWTVSDYGADVTMPDVTK